LRDKAKIEVIDPDIKKAMDAAAAKAPEEELPDAAVEELNGNN
jgi:hypothetical protein